MQKLIKTIYSAYSGTYLEIPESDLKHLKMGQFPVIKKASSSCKKCFGRGNIGRDNENLFYQLCNCVIKAIDKEDSKKIFANGIEL